MAITSHVTTPRVIGLAILLPATYALFTYRKLTRATTSKSGRWRGCHRKGAPELQQKEEEEKAIEPPGGLPEEIQQDDSGWVVSYERVNSRPVPASALAYPFPAAVEDGTGVSSILKVYTRAAQLAFSWTPQAFAIRAATGVAKIRRTFDTEYIRSLDFHQGSIVNGAYQVSLHTSRLAPAAETLELSLVPPPDYRGPIFKGLILTRIEEVAEPVGEKQSVPDHRHVIFVNETWMWRRETEAATLLESPVGAWVHRVMAGFLVTKGMAAVMGD
jgi:hypothetical protein